MATKPIADLRSDSSFDLRSDSSFSSAQLHPSPVIRRFNLFIAAKL